MALSIDDLKPKKFKITLDGVELLCSPLRLSHALIVAKIGDVLQNPKEKTIEEIKQAEKDMDDVICELIPELKGIELDVNSIMSVVMQMTNSNNPSENQELQDKGVSFDSEDPKAPKQDTRIG